MFIKKILSPEQSLIIATSRITSYGKAIEELVYNALDAQSTSIAIRVDMDQTSIQVIDNGCGITKKDLCLTGQRYMTSKYTEKSNSELPSGKYGSRGESLSNIVEVSKIVKITSRYESTDATWEKCIRECKSGNVVEVDRRPSKGTTIEIKGFLYNLKIQSKSIKQLKELQEIKLFLERIVLVHIDVSLSLRDDSRNEIIFQVHKKRDVYQTISQLYGVEKSEIQELKVEKNQYAVTAFISKGIKDINKDCIFLNQKYLNSSSRLHKIMNDNLNKSLNDKYHRKKSKIKYNDEVMYLLRNKAPFYFLFIQCPITDYVMIDKDIEFNKWDQITKLLEKLTKFYVSDANFKTVTNNLQKEENNNLSEDTRKQVKKIINKILSSNSKMLGVSQMQNGVKGKITKRKKTKNNKSNCKIISQNKLTTKHIKVLANKKVFAIDSTINNTVQPITIKNNLKRKVNNKLRKDRLNKTNTNLANNISQHVEKYKQMHGSDNFNLKEILPHLSNKQLIYKRKSKPNDELNGFINDSVVRRFINPTDSVKERCEILAQKAQKVLDDFNNKICATHVDKSVQYSYKDEQDKNVSAYKRRKYKHLNKNVPVQKNKKSILYLEHNSSIKSNYDLLNTIINTQINNDKTNGEYKSVVSRNKFTNYEYKSCYTSSEVMPYHRPITSKLTYESHKYEMTESKIPTLKDPIHAKFIPKMSTEDFLSPNCVRRQNRWQRNFTRNLNRKQLTFEKNNTLFDNNSAIYSTIQNVEDYSQIFEWSQNSITNIENNDDDVTTLLPRFSLGTFHIGNVSHFVQNTYTTHGISENMEWVLNNTYRLPNHYTMNNDSSIHNQENKGFDAIPHLTIHDSNTCVERSECIFTEEIENIDFNKISNDNRDAQIEHISDSQDLSKSKTLDTNYAPIEVCEAVYLSNDVFEKEFQISFNNTNQKDLDSNQNSIFNDVDDDNKRYMHINIKNTSHHFSSTYKANTSTVNDKKQTTDPMQDNPNNELLNDRNHNGKYETIKLNTFELKNRLPFVPKGMSPIFKNCNTKQTSHNNLDTDYYEDSLYHNFINEVHINSEIYMEQIQNLNEEQIKSKCKNKTNTESAINFDGKSLECAKVLNQVDNKFIATIIKDSRNYNEEPSNFLVLFDQHAVHERIRLETNLSEYLIDGQWKSVCIDGMTMLLPKDELLYLHNYKEKFAQLGLQWTISSKNEIQITAIPEAILGKNTRQVDKIMNAVRNLITEQVNNIKSQNGCISMYPKSIMDLVFSEACRYAVMFGDKLTKDYCEELLKALSKCKKPFQCAHGRPVMAVLMDLENNKHDYKANLAKIKRFNKGE